MSIRRPIKRRFGLDTKEPDGEDLQGCRTGILVADMGEAGSESGKSYFHVQRIGRLHANVLAFTLIHGPQHYEPLFYAHKIDGNSVPIVDEWCCGYVKGIALDPEGWQPLIDARPD
jgi:hypothetical protein